MARSIIDKHKQKIAEAARLTRLDYAAATFRGTAMQADVPTAKSSRHAATAAKRKAIRGGAVLTPDFCMAVEIAKPLQVSISMNTAYAAALLRQLRDAKKPRRGECHQLSVDCPVEIMADGATMKALIEKLEIEVGGEA